MYKSVCNPVLVNFNGNRKVINVSAGTTLRDFKLMVQNVYGIPTTSQYIRRAGGCVNSIYLRERNAVVEVNLFLVGGSKCPLLCSTRIELKFVTSS